MCAGLGVFMSVDINEEGDGFLDGMRAHLVLLHLALLLFTDVSPHSPPQTEGKTSKKIGTGSPAVLALLWWSGSPLQYLRGVSAQNDVKTDRQSEENRCFIAFR